MCDMKKAGSKAGLPRYLLCFQCLSQTPNSDSDPPIKDKKSLPIEPAGTLIARDRLGSHHAMEGKARFVFPVLISGLIVFVVGAVVTFTNIGLRADFVVRWLKAFVTGWPVAALLAFFAGPYIRRAAEAIVRRIDGAAQSYCAGLMPSVSPIRLTVCS